MRMQLYANTNAFSANNKSLHICLLRLVGSLLWRVGGFCRQMPTPDMKQFRQIRGFPCGSAANKDMPNNMRVALYISGLQKKKQILIFENRFIVF